MSGRPALSIILGVLLLSVAKASLFFMPFDPAIPCGDGSPAGLYSNHQTSVSVSRNPKKHIIVFEGGGACMSPEDCIAEFESEPFKFSSKFLPEEIKGHTILSETEADKNPFQNFTKWLVPYCSQDLFLGRNQGPIGGFFHSGSEIFESAILHWKNTSAMANDTFQDAVTSSQLVIVGISAGAVGVMNHVGLVREAAREVGAQSVLFILDSSMISDDYQGKSFAAAMEMYVDLAKHPLCSPLNAFSELYQDISDLPCCLSTHCMMRHSEALDGSNDTTAFMLLDSAYDPLTLLSRLSSLGTSSNANFASAAMSIWAGGEAAGTRKSRTLETAVVSKLLKPSLGSNVHWLIASCVTHGFLVPSIELLHLYCQHGIYDGKDFHYVCRGDGAGVHGRIKIVDLKITLWKTTEMWHLQIFDGYSARDIISDFVISSGHIENQTVHVKIDGCSGPNCMSDIEPNQYQSLIELDETFTPISPLFQVLWFFTITSLIATIAMRFSSPLETTQRVELTEKSLSTALFSQSILCGTPKKEKSKLCSIMGLQVSHTKSKRNLLTAVDLNLLSGTVLGLMGRTGSGKSTLLQAISMLGVEGATVSFMNDCSQLHQLKKAYLRQGESVTMENLTAADFLYLTAQVYGAKQEKLQNAYILSKQLLGRITEENDREVSLGMEPLATSSEGDECTGPSVQPGHSKHNIFYCTKIKNLSGGQRRVLAIASKLLSDPSVILLDEPLSGMDSASSVLIMRFVQLLAACSNCAIIMSLHQPSDDILQYIDQVAVLEAGKFVVDFAVKENLPHSKIAADLNQLLYFFAHASGTNERPFMLSKEFNCLQAHRIKQDQCSKSFKISHSFDNSVGSVTVSDKYNECSS